MEITAPNILWKDYDVDALPLNITELSGKEENGKRVREMYFDGHTIVDGRVRAFLRVYENTDAGGIVLYLPNGSADSNDILPKKLFDKGYSIAELDYAGKTDSSPRFTIYPNSLISCNLNETTIFDAPDDALRSNWFIWTCIARRALRVIAQLYPQKRIYAVGKGLGGCTVYKLAAFTDGLTACATMLSVIPEVTGQGNQIINYRAALDNSAYAPLTKVPIFMAVCSNDQDGMFDKMAELALSTETLGCFRVIERAFSDGIRSAYDQIPMFFKKCDSNENINYHITIKPKNSDNNLYFNIQLETGETEIDVEKAEFFNAFCIEDATNRNWTNIPTMRLAGNEYIAHIAVLQDEKPVYGFVNVTDKDGYVMSSPLLTVIPKTLGITPQQGIKRRLIYDGSMGTDVWMTPRGGEIKTVSGPYNIEGVTAENHTLVTFKPGDLLYRADGDELLQLQISGKCNEIRFTVSDGKETYTDIINLQSTDEWNRFTLSHNDFKGQNGPLDDWSKIIMFNLEADGEFIVGSLLWV